MNEGDKMNMDNTLYTDLEFILGYDKAETITDTMELLAGFMDTASLEDTIGTILTGEHSSEVVDADLNIALSDAAHGVLFEHNIAVQRTTCTTAVYVKLLTMLTDLGVWNTEYSMDILDALSNSVTQYGTFINIVTTITDISESDIETYVEDVTDRFVPALLEIYDKLYAENEESDTTEAPLNRLLATDTALMKTQVVKDMSTSGIYNDGADNYVWNIVQNIPEDAVAADEVVVYLMTELRALILVVSKSASTDAETLLAVQETLIDNDIGHSILDSVIHELRVLFT